MTIALVDADTIYYRAAFRKNKKDIRKGIKEAMLNIESQCFASDMMVAVKGHGNFRKDLYPKYKANRKVDDDLKQWLTYGWEYMIDEYNGVKADGMEADDLVSIWANEARARGQSFVVCGIDKDLLQIPGMHFNYHKNIHQEVDEDAANYNLMLQCLTGDSTDNIPGIRGVGPVKAKKILRDVSLANRWGVIRTAWRDHSAGDPSLSHSLLKMLETWDEYEDIRASISGETPECEQDVCEEGTDNVQDSGLPEVSERDS